MRGVGGRREQRCEDRGGAREMTDLPPAIIRSDGAPLAGSDLTGHDSWTQTCATAAHDRPAPLALDRLPQCPAAFGARGILTHQTTAFVVATPAKHRTSSHRTRVAPSISRSCPRSRPDALPPLLPPNSRLILPGLITVVRPSYIARPSQLPGPACTCSMHMLRYRDPAFFAWLLRQRRPATARL